MCEGCSKRSPGEVFQAAMVLQAVQRGVGIEVSLEEARQTVMGGVSDRDGGVNATSQRLVRQHERQTHRRNGNGRHLAPRPVTMVIRPVRTWAGHERACKNDD